MAAGMAAISVTLACSYGGATKTIAIGINPWPGYETLYLAQEKRFFARHGLSVELKEYSSLGDARRAYERGQIEGMACTMVEVLQAREQSNREGRVVMVVDYSQGADVIMAKPGTRSLGELRGKRVGLELASLGIYIMSRAVALNGMRLGDLQLVPTDQSEMEQSAREGKIDAAVTYPPASVHLDALGWRSIFDSRRIPGEVVDVVAIDRRVLESHPGFQMAFIAAMEDAIAFLATSRREAIGIMAARERISTADFERALDRIQLVEPREMPRYLAPGGPLEPVFEVLERELELAGQLSKIRGTRDLIAYLPRDRERR